MTLLIGNDYATAILDLATTQQLWAGLYTAMPTQVDPLSAEVAGGGYARPAVNLQRTGRRLVNENALVFPGVPQGSIIAVGLLTAAVNGDLYLAASFNPRLTVPGGVSVVLEPGEVAFGI